VRSIPSADEVVAEARALLPTLVRDEGPVRRSIKSVLVPCSVNGTRVMVKRRFDDKPAWRWYDRREPLVLEALSPALGVCTPKVVAVDQAAGLLVMTRVGGVPVASRRHSLTRHPSNVWPRERWEKLVTCVHAIRHWSQGAQVAHTLASLDASDDDRTTMMRARVLEDPSRPLDWIVEGLERVAAPMRHESIAALRAYPTLAFAHGDLLLRNVLDDDGVLGLVDWECAGWHAEAWDAALVWVWAPEWARNALAHDFATPDARRAFGACAVFAVSREAYYRSTRPEGDVTVRLREDLDAAIALLD
jgi:aminoglycoside phosphotransferase